MNTIRKYNQELVPFARTSDMADFDRISLYDGGYKTVYCGFGRTSHYRATGLTPVACMGCMTQDAF
jgi:hypothetical protein